MKAPMDAYTFRARLQPPLLAALPSTTTVIAFYPDGVTWWTSLWAAIIACGGTYLIAEFGRDPGRQKQPTLYDSWGGTPTTQRLRHRDAPNTRLVDRYHARLHELRPDLVFPTPDAELADPQGADDLYEAAANYLLEATRDRNRFHLVYEALCEYGFRRNLWGLKPAGVAVSLFSLGLSTAAIVCYLFGTTAPPTPSLIAAAVINALFVFAWLFLIRPDWVKTTAFAYADRLLASCETIGSQN